MSVGGKQISADTLYKSVILLLMGMCSFFLVRMSTQFDEAIKRIEVLEINVAVILRQTK